MNLKIVTWNMAFWSHKLFLDRAWRYFVEEVNADIYLFQEACPPQELKNDPNFLWFQIGGNRKWGTGIYSNKYPLRHLQIQSNYTGSLVLGEVKVTENLELTIISLYGLLEKVGNTAYAITTLHRMLSDLTGVLNGHIGGKRNIILGGDLNASIQCDIYDGGKAHDLFFQRLENFNLINCFSPYFNDFVQTHRHGRSDKPWQNDYLFISKRLAKNLKSCGVLDNEDVRKFSDHNPVVMTLEF